MKVSKAMLTISALFALSACAGVSSGASSAMNRLSFKSKAALRLVEK
jgi:hypothetical protein